MGEVITIGLDIAKSEFEVHGVDADGTVVIRACPMLRDELTYLTRILNKQKPEPRPTVDVDRLETFAYGGEV